MKKQIDIIIPAYNAHHTIGKALASIASQIISDLISVTIVNDHSKQDYSEFINTYSNILDIKEITLEENVGCGRARQIGLDSTTNKYIMFVDADDFFTSPFSVFALYNTITRTNKGKRVNIVYGCIEEVESKTGVVKAVMQADHGTWLFGSIYRREYIDAIGLRFNDSSRGEDVSFNKICKLMSDPDKIVFSQAHTYFWTDANINRINNDIFRILYSKLGYVENMLYVYDFLSKKTKEELYYPEEEMKFDYLSNFNSIFFQYNELIVTLQDIKEKVGTEELKESFIELINTCQQLYEVTIRKQENSITNEDVAFVYNLNLNRISKQGRSPFPEPMTFAEFLNSFRNKDTQPLVDNLLEII